MNSNTINDLRTIAGNEAGTLLANRYRVIRQLGQGGMGSVWLVADTQLDDKLFAIKMLPPILVANRRAYRQLKDEALVAMKLVHPNIVQIRAFEENGGNPFLVMDYVDGDTLDNCLGEWGPLSQREAMEILKPIATALDYAHAQGVVHRDVKPANVMVRTDGQPFILDFGIAREVQDILTRVTGKFSSGTLLYMSPEQLGGDPPTKQQDVYSFAAMAYECMKGSPPFTRGDISDQVKNKLPEPLRGGTKLVLSVMAGLAKNPADRPQSCMAVLAGGNVVPHIRVPDKVKIHLGQSNDKSTSPASIVRKALLVMIPLMLVAVGGILWYRHGRRLSRRERMWDPAGTGNQETVSTVIDTEVQELRDKIKSLEDMVDTEKKEKESVEVSLQELKKEKEGVEVKLNEANSTVGSLMNEVSTARAEKAKVEADLENSKKKVEDLKADVEGLKEKTKVEANLENPKKEVEDLKADIEDYKGKVKDEQAKVEELVEECESQKKKYDNLMEAYKRMLSSAPRVASGNGSVVGGGQLTSGVKGKLEIANNEKLFAVVKFEDSALDELLGSERNSPLPPHEMLVCRPVKDASGKEKKNIIGRIRLRQWTPKTNFVTVDILGDWQQEPFEKGDVVMVN